MLHHAVLPSRIRDANRLWPLVYNWPLQSIGDVAVSQGNPEKAANFLQRLTFGWLDPLLILGYKRPLGARSEICCPPPVVGRAALPAPALPKRRFVVRVSWDVSSN